MGLGMIHTALNGLWFGLGIAFQPQNLMWCFFGVLAGNLVGVLPGMGPVATISILLPLTFAMKPVAAILMLAGVFLWVSVWGSNLFDFAQSALPPAPRGHLPRWLSAN